MQSINVPSPDHSNSDKRALAIRCSNEDSDENECHHASDIGSDDECVVHSKSMFYINCLDAVDGVANESQGRSEASVQKHNPRHALHNELAITTCARRIRNDVWAYGTYHRDSLQMHMLHKIRKTHRL